MGSHDHADFHVGFPRLEIVLEANSQVECAVRNLKMDCEQTCFFFIQPKEGCHPQDLSSSKACGKCIVQNKGLVPGTAT